MMLLAAGLMWALDHWMPLGRWISAPWNRLGGLVAAVGVAIAVAAFVRFRRMGTTVSPVDPSKASRLVADGVFRVSRNPMYLGLLLLLIGWAIWLGSASPWLVPPLFVIVITLVQIIPEERALGRQLRGGVCFVPTKRGAVDLVGAGDAVIGVDMQGSLSPRRHEVVTDTSAFGRHFATVLRARGRGRASSSISLPAVAAAYRIPTEYRRFIHDFRRTSALRCVVTETDRSPG